MQEPEMLLVDEPTSSLDPKIAVRNDGINKTNS